MSHWKYAVNASFFGLRRDRFSQYQPNRSLEERFSLVSQIPDVEGIELKYPRDFADLTLVHTLLDKHDLTLCAVNVDTKDITHFRYGALSSRDASTRERAVNLLKQGMDIAAELGTNIVTTCPLAEGYDYPFQIPYDEAWEAFIDSVVCAANHRQDINLVLEYQPHEPHARILLSNVGKMLHVCAEVNAPNFGANLDIGHSFAAGESPAESAVLLARKGWLKYIHTNDNTGEGGDWDMISGSIHFWDWLDLIYTLKKVGYEGWLSGDIQSKHFTPTQAYAKNIKMIQRMTTFLERADTGKLDELLHEDGHTPELYDYLSGLMVDGE
jgi:xylose isomerase